VHPEIRGHLVLVVDAKCISRSCSGRRLGYQRKTDLACEAECLFDAVRQAMPGTWKPMPRQHAFHTGLVAKVPRRLGTQPADAQRIAHLTQRHLQILEHSNQTLDWPEALRAAACRIRDLLRVEPVRDAVVSRQPLTKSGWQSLLGILRDETEPDPRERCHRLDESEGGLAEERCNEDDVGHGEDANPKPCGVLEPAVTSAQQGRGPC
jgi:hypothetical protein